MKFCVALFALLSISNLMGQQNPSVHYRPVHTLSLSGDFDGDGKTDTLRHFTVDSLGTEVNRIIELDPEADGYYPMLLSDKYGYSGAITLNGKPADIPEGTDIFVYCLINLGNINRTPGDEIALVPSNLDFSSNSHCAIYSLCNGRWVKVFSFSVTENAFDYSDEIRPLFTTIPEYLEKRNGKWMYMDYQEWLTADNPKMLPLKVGNCN